MKMNYIIKGIPILSTLLLILFISISNQKEYTNLKILIWKTPSLKLGSYLAISTGSGFILSYFITTSIGKLNQLKPKKSINYKDNKDKEVINLNSKIDNFKNAIEENNNTYESLIDKTTKSLEKIIEKTENISKVQ